MGYYTQFHLDVFKSFKEAQAEYSFADIKPIEREEILKIAYELNKILLDNKESFENFSKNFANTSTDNILYFIVSEEPMKWYTYESDMKELSKKFPEIWFTLTGIGEEYDDEWKAICNNGRFEQVFVEKNFPEIFWD